MPALPASPRHVLNRLRRPLLILLALGCLSCGGGGSSGADTLPPPQPADATDISILMMGNSHTSTQQLPAQLAALVRAVAGGRTVGATVAPGWMFLEEHFHNPSSMNLLRGQRWSVVVLQAQKYSTSGFYSYSTSEAEEMVRIARTAGALPVLFPEWPRENVGETERIYELHVSIAQKQAACVAPVGQAWDLALQRHPTLRLHQADGNHALPAGAYLAALMLYATITGAAPQSLLALPDLNNNVDPAVQARLRQVAADTALAFPPRRYCPAA